MDSGVFLSRWPKQWLQITEEEGICVLEDPRQINEQWCHETFCRKLEVSSQEKSSQQIWAGALAFVAGHPKANELIGQAYKWSKERDVIVGPKWEGMRNGRPFGHRHDQSILSILSQRLDIARYPMDEIYCDHSLRKTYLTGKCLYVHRGAFTVHKPFAQDIDDCFVINLDKRKDRMEKLFTNNPELKDRVQRLSAVHGLSLQLTPAIARLFKPHDFFWKKAVLGCALSHLTLWWQLANERPEIQSYLILEDDAKLQKGWEEKWNAAAPYIPEDYDVVYLGGILPPNRHGFELVKEKVNDHVSRVAPNNFFGQQEANRYFHWCAYAYVLSREGAKKILNILQEQDGYWTSADHMICNRIDKMNLYFLDPLVAGCYQDDDPRYQTSQFNDFNRIDGFDSDLWNNDERFSNEEVQKMMAIANEQNIGINIVRALEDLKTGRVSVETKVNLVEPKEEVLNKETGDKKKLVSTVEEFQQNQSIQFLGKWTLEHWKSQEMLEKLQGCIPHLQRSSFPAQDPSIPVIRSTHQHWKQMKPSGETETLWATVEKKLADWAKCSELYEGIPKAPTRRFLTLQEHNFQGETAYEKEWIQELLGPQIPFRVERISSADPPPTDKPIVLVQRPWIDSYIRLFEKWEAAGCGYSVLHVSDEYATDRIDFYHFSQCLGVVRIYHRSDIGTELSKKVATIPLGYHWTLAGGSEDPVSKTPRLPFRNTVWSFYGTRWMNREEMLEPLKEIGPHNLLLVDSWESPEKLTRNQYVASLLDTVFVPCPGGNNIETFRLYEALECGCIPIYVKIPGDDAYVEMLQTELGLLAVSSWVEAKLLMAHFFKEKEIMESYRNTVLLRWKGWKVRLGEKIRSIWAL
jgi:GR25 family glycosyltransferase involved in LPS biosynthesis